MPKILAERRERRVMFRLSEAEYERLRRLCLVCHKSSVSELVRVAVDHWVESGGRERYDSLNSKMRELEERLESLASRVHMLGQSS
jgi:hypothetical protein